MVIHIAYKQYAFQKWILIKCLIRKARYTNLMLENKHTDFSVHELTDDDNTFWIEKETQNAFLSCTLQKK